MNGGFSWLASWGSLGAAGARRFLARVPTHRELLPSRCHKRRHVLAA